jgi:hypothetical protein
MAKRFTFNELMLKVDFFGQPFHFLLPDKHQYYRSFLGAMLSILMVTLVLAFTVYRFVSLSEKWTYYVAENYHRFAFGATEAFKSKDGFAVAVGITEFDGKSIQDYVEDPSVGTLKFY